MPAARLRLLCLLPSIPLGGMERAAIRVVEHLMSAGAEAHFVAERTWAKAVHRQIESIGATWTGVPFVASLGMPKIPLEWAMAARSFALSQRDLARATDAYAPRQILATNSSIAWFARDLARREDVTSVFRLPNPPGLSGIAVKRKMDLATWRAIYDSYDVLVCNSKYTAGRLAEVVQDDKRIRVIRNYAPQEVRGSVTPAPRLAPERITIGYLGQITRAKGVDILVDAALDIVAERANVDVVLAGPDGWKDPFGGEMRSKVRERGREDRIRFLGSIGDVYGLLRQCAFHVCPSAGNNESFPNVVLDAKQAGIPSIVFPTAGLPEAIEHGTDGLITEDCSRDALSRALLRLIDDGQLRRRLAHGAARSLARHDAATITADWIGVLGGGA
jgi:glycosyltransferase involved in cell wall biosynthesis